MKFVALLVVLVATTGLNGQGLLMSRQKSSREIPISRADKIMTHRPVVESSVRRMSSEEVVFGNCVILGMSVGDVPTNCVAKVVQIPILMPKSWELEGEKREWRTGDGAVTVAMCVGKWCPPLDVRGGMLSSYSENKDVFRDFSYSDDGRLIRVSEPYIVDPVLKPIEAKSYPLGCQNVKPRDKSVERQK